MGKLVTPRSETPVRFEVVKPLPHLERIKRWLKMGARIAGGLPVWACGAGSTYTDIDLYADNWETFSWIRGELHCDGKYIGETRETFEYMLNQSRIQLVKPFEEYGSVVDLICNTDMTATACALVLDGDNRDKLVVISMYPEDLENHVTRILIDHEWTYYRADSYRRRGFNVVNIDGTPYEFKKGS